MEKQNEFLAQALEKIRVTPASEVSVGAVSADLAAFQQTQTQILSDLLERQNAQMTASIDAILKQTQELSARQMETVEKLSQRINVKPQRTYDVMIEEEGMPTVTDTPSEQTYTNRYRSDTVSVYRPAEVELEPVTEQSESSVFETAVSKRYTASSETERDEIKSADNISIIPDWKG